MIEVNSRFRDSSRIVPLAHGATIEITPPIDAGYFLARVPLFNDQAIQIFPKFGTIGCGFAQEEDWNTNLPLSTRAEEIYAHIKHNKRYLEITDEMCLAAIRELQQWWGEHRPAQG